MTRKFDNPYGSKKGGSPINIHYYLHVQLQAKRSKNKEPEFKAEIKLHYNLHNNSSLRI